MNDTNDFRISDGTEGFDQDFLWAFRKLEYVAICLSLDHRIIDVTSAAETLFVVSRKELLDSSVFSLFSRYGLNIAFSNCDKDPSIEVVDKNIANTHRAQKLINLSWKIKPKVAFNGKNVGFILYAEELRDIEYLAQVYKVVTGQGEITGGSVKDYAENVKDYLENIIALMPGNIYWMDKNCIYLGCNDNDARFLGLKSRKEIIGLTDEELEKKARWTQGHIDLWRRDNLEVMASGKPKLNVEEKPVLMPNGKEIFYLTSRVPIFDKNKNVISVIGISIDITDLKLMERELQLTRERADKAEKELLVKVNQEITGQVWGEKQSPVAYVKNVQNYLENIIASLPGDIFWMDSNCVLLGCNDNEAKFLGLKSRKDIVGMTYEDLAKNTVFPEQIKLWKQQSLEVIATGKPLLNFEEEPILLPTGEEKLRLMNKVPMFDDQHNIIGVAGVAIDISDRKRAEKLQKEKEIAEKTAQVMKMLAGSLAHEIRTPLAIIGVNIDLLEMARKNKIEIDQEKHFKTIKYAIKLGASIIDNILTMLNTLFVGKTITSKFKSLSILDGINEAIEIYPFLDHEKSLVVLKKSKDFTYWGDKILTQHVLFNLFKNALRSIKEAGRGEIKINTKVEKKYNVLKFIDTVGGVTEKDRVKIFEQFATRFPGGAGLGLAFCKMVMQTYGGDIICRSKKGKYTEFILNFPKIPTKCKS